MSFETLASFQILPVFRVANKASYNYDNSLRHRVRDDSPLQPFPFFVGVIHTLFFRNSSSIHLGQDARNFFLETFSFLHVFYLASRNAETEKAQKLSLFSQHLLEIFFAFVLYVFHGISFSSLSLSLPEAWP